MFLQIESENHCTGQMRGLIDEVSIKQSQIVALQGICLESYMTMFSGSYQQIIFEWS